MDLITEYEPAHRQHGYAGLRRAEVLKVSVVDRLRPRRRVKPAYDDFRVVTEYAISLDIRPHFRYEPPILPIEGRHR